MHHDLSEPTTSSLLFLIPLLPLLGALVNLTLGKHIQDRFGKAPIHWLAILMPGLSAVIGWTVVLPGVIHNKAGLYQYLWDWVVVGMFDAHLAFHIDTLNCVMVLIVTTVGTLIHVYATGYMAEEPSYWRFFGYLNIFMFAMLTLVMGDNFLLMFVGWEGVGFASWALIGFWYRNKENAVAGMKAFVVNRIGDFAFIIGMGLLFWGFQGSFSSPLSQGESGYMMSHEATEQTRAFVAGTPEHDKHLLDTAAGHAEAPVASITFRVLQAQLAQTVDGSMPDRVCEHGHCTDEERPKTRGDLLAEKKVWGLPLLLLVCVLFFIGATGKSAQLPLYVWLPDAMAGPTPVSALIHAATMVTAGVYMIARLNFLYALSPGAMTVVATVGALTALFAATIGFFQYDIKKVLAYSTVSQLGFMFIGVGVGAYWAGIFHLLTHACFKACLFLGSGSVIMGSHHNQDMRWMGGLKKYMPKTAFTYWAACVAIAGFPLGAGFYSKDEILWKAFDSGNVLLPGGGLMIWLLGFIAATGTSFYMWRSYYVTFTGQNRHHEMPADVAHALHAKHDSDMGLFWDPEARLIVAGAGDHSGHGHDDHAHGDQAISTQAAHADHVAHAGEGHAASSHGDGATFVPHESPLNVTIVLQILAGASLLIGVVLGFPVLWAHTFHLPIPNMFEHWIHHTMATTEKLVDSAGFGTGVEWLLAGGSVLVATIGWLGARALYRNRGLPIADAKLANFDVHGSLQRLAAPRDAIPSESGLGKLFDVLEAAVAFCFRLLARLLLGIGAMFGTGFSHVVRGGWRLVLDKYRVDELYEWLVVRRVVWLTRFLWDVDKLVIDGAVHLAGFMGKVAGFLSGGFDRVFVDGAVNGLAEVVMATGNRLRRLQNGQIQSYLLGIAGGSIALVVLNYLIFGN
ncbi:MAG: proton-conducting transporter membrane subunit [Pseudomonadota bacterium]